MSIGITKPLLPRSPRFRSVVWRLSTLLSRKYRPKSQRPEPGNCPQAGRVGSDSAGQGEHFPTWTFRVGLEHRPDIVATVHAAQQHDTISLEFQRPAPSLIRGFHRIATACQMRLQNDWLRRPDTAASGEPSPIRSSPSLICWTVCCTGACSEVSPNSGRAATKQATRAILKNRPANDRIRRQNEQCRRDMTVMKATLSARGTALLNKIHQSNRLS